MYCAKLNYFINNRYERPEIWLTPKQYGLIIEMRNDTKLRDNLINVQGSGITFSPKDIAWIDYIDKDNAWWKENAPAYLWENIDNNR